MTKAKLLKEILKLEKSLLRSYLGLRTNKFRRSNQAFNEMMDIFREVKSTGKYRTIVKSRMKKDELYNYYEKLKYIRGLESSTAKGWQKILKENRDRAKENGVDVDFIDDNYDDFKDFEYSRAWQESAYLYYDSGRLNAMRWMEEGEQFTYFKEWIMEREVANAELIKREHFTPWSEVINQDNWKDMLKAAWEASRM